MFGMLVKAKLSNTESLNPLNSVTLMFNPEEFTLTRNLQWTSREVPGLDAPIQQFGGGGGLDLELNGLIFDTSKTGLDVKTWYTDVIDKMAQVDADLHRPPIVKFEWASTSVEGVIQRVNIRFTHFTSSGTPVRASVDLTINEVAGVATELQSPDHTKLHTVRLGETLDQIAFKEYEDPAHWKTIAEANDLDDPSRLRPGQRLMLPRLY